MTVTNVVNKVGILICSYNRPEYFRQCLSSLQQAKLPENCSIALIDDCSTDKELLELFQNFNLFGFSLIKIRNAKNMGIKHNRRIGFNKLFQDGCSIVLNFDSDSIFKENAILKLVEAKEKHLDNIVTGFNCTMLNPDGSERHPIIRSHSGYHEKKSVGGINMCFEYPQYTKYILPALEQPSGNWDHMACIASMKQGNAIITLFPSLVQHIGLVSSLGHSGSEPDQADDYDERMKLKDVTLFGIDSLDFSRLKKAAEISQKQIKFGEVVLLDIAGAPYSLAWELKTKQDYSYFMIKELHNHIHTSHVLVIQWDGYILNPAAWKDEWLQYDYIGATWLYKDGHNVGNGGFSLRSKKLLIALATDKNIIQEKNIIQARPEDDSICRYYRKYLEETHQIKFAPEEVANRFSIEAYGCSVLPTANRYSNQFGFHGFGVDFTGATIPHIPKAPVKNSNPYNPLKRFR